VRVTNTPRFEGTMPRPPLPTNVAPPQIDLTSRRLASAMNVAVFTPYAIYLAQGKRPPMWLTLASLAWLGVNFLDDLKFLTSNEPQEMGNLQCNCAHPSSRTIPSDINTPMVYRVNRM